jgi:nucleotide-binding universal stress UspA family protein
MKLNKILVPLDGSPLAEAALPTAMDLAKDSPGVTIALLRAAEAPAMTVMDTVTAQVMAVRESEEYLDAVAARLKAQGVTVTTSTWYGTPASSIVRAAEAGHVDLIVMNSHGRSGLNRLVIGSVAEHVLRGTRTPILLLRVPGAPVEAPAGKAELRSTKQPAHV